MREQRGTALTVECVVYFYSEKAEQTSRTEDLKHSICDTWMTRSDELHDVDILDIGPWDNPKPQYSVIDLGYFNRLPR